MSASSARIVGWVRARMIARTAPTAASNVTTGSRPLSKSSPDTSQPSTFLAPYESTQKV